MEASEKNQVVAPVADLVHCSRTPANLDTQADHTGIRC